MVHKEQAVQKGKVEKQQKAIDKARNAICLDLERHMRKMHKVQNIPPACPAGVTRKENGWPSAKSEGGLVGC